MEILTKRSARKCDILQFSVGIIFHVWLRSKIDIRKISVAGGSDFWIDFSAFGQNKAFSQIQIIDDPKCK